MMSVVVASCRSPELLEQTLASLLPQSRAAGAELIVARADSTGEPIGGTPASDADYRIIDCPPHATIPEIRGAGLAAATGEWVLLTEDNCVAAPDWLTRMQHVCLDGVHVAGGSMANARPERGIDAGASFAEYGFFGPFRRADGVPPLVTGANVAYHRSVVGKVATWASDGDWEDVIHSRLADAAAVFAVAPDALVLQNLHYRLGPFCVDRYEHGRDYARVRAPGTTALQRLRLIATTPLLPIVLAARIWKSAGRSTPGAFIRALPWTLTFLGAWSWGEAIGYLTPEQTA